MAGDAIHSFLLMFRFYPGLKETRGSFLVVGDTESHVDLFDYFRSSDAHGERRPLYEG